MITNISGQQADLEWQRWVVVLRLLLHDFALDRLWQKQFRYGCLGWHFYLHANVDLVVFKAVSRLCFLCLTMAETAS